MFAFFLADRAKPGAALQTPLRLMKTLTDSSFVKISLRRRHALTVGDGASTHKIDYVRKF